MRGGTLLVSRSINNHEYYKQRLETLGFYNVTVTDLERDALNSLINDMKPSLILMSARFYHCCTPYHMGQLKKKFPKIKMAAVSVGEYPVDVAMYFIINGVKSYINSFEGLDQFYKGLVALADGRDYISPEVIERIKIRNEIPEPSGNITERHREILRLICCGFTENEIAETLHISRRTVTTHKTEIYKTLNIRNPVELVRSALTIKLLQLEELHFYPRDLTVNPLPKNKYLKRGKK